MALAFEESTRGTKVLLDNKHLKTIPKRYVPFFEKVIEKINFENRRLNPSERNFLEIELQFKKLLDKLPSSERCLTALIKDKTPVSAKMVITPNYERMEITLNNDMKITTNNLRLFNLLPKVKPSLQNY